MKEQREALKGIGVAILEEGPERSTAERSEAGRSAPKSRRRRRGARALAARLRFRVPKFLTSRGAVVLRWRLSVLKKADVHQARRARDVVAPRGAVLVDSAGWRRQRRQGTLAALRAVGRQTRSIPWLRVSRSSSMRFAGSSTMPRPSSTSKKNSPRCWGSQ